MISVLTTVFNREAYISDCIESVQNSTYNNWEMIIVDDCSSDNSVNIANKYAEKDKRIKVYKNEKNLGDYPNRNKATSLASGKYLKYLDADDMIYPYGLEIMVQSMEKYPEAALGISEYVVEDYDPYPFLLSPEEIYSREYLKRGILGVGPTATIIRKDTFDKMGGFTGTRYIGDRELWLKLSKHYPVLKIQAGLVFWRRHDNQEISYGRNNNSYLILDYNLNIKSLESDDCPLKEPERNKGLKRLKKRHARNILNLYKKGAMKSAWEVMKETKFSLNDIFRYV